MVFDSPSLDREWKKDETASLITLYESEPSLYDNNHPRYFDPHERNNAYQRIHQIMLRIRPDCQLYHIKNRVGYLRSQYAAERLHKDATIKSGIYTEETYKPSLWCFALLQFLDDFVPSTINSEMKQVEEEIDEESKMEDDEQSDNLISDSRTDYQNNKDVAGSSNGRDEVIDDLSDSEGSSKKKRKLDSISRTSRKEQNVPEKISVPQPVEREDIFGQYVASEMKTLRDNPLLYLQTKQAILEILTSANFELINPE